MSGFSYFVLLCLPVGICLFLMPPGLVPWLHIHFMQFLLGIFLS